MTTAMRSRARSYTTNSPAASEDIPATFARPISLGFSSAVYTCTPSGFYGSLGHASTDKVTWKPVYPRLEPQPDGRLQRPRSPCGLCPLTVDELLHGDQAGARPAGPSTRLGRSGRDGVTPGRRARGGWWWPARRSDRGPPCRRARPGVGNRPRLLYSRYGCAIYVRKTFSGRIPCELEIDDETDTCRVDSNGCLGIASARWLGSRRCRR